MGTVTSKVLGRGLCLIDLVAHHSFYLQSLKQNNTSTRDSKKKGELECIGLLLRVFLGEGGGQLDKKVLSCTDLALNFIPFSRITIFPYQGFFV